MSNREVLFHIEKWLGEKDRFIYKKLGPIDFELETVNEWLPYEKAVQLNFKPISPGSRWGQRWHYGWFKGTVTMPDLPGESRLVVRMNLGGDSTVYVNGKLAGSRDWKHSDVLLSNRATKGEQYEILAEVYAGHEGEEQPLTGESTIAIVNESFYQFFIDLKIVYQLRNSLEPGSLRVSEIDRGLRKLVAELDWSLPEAELEKEADKGRSILKPLLDCVNGSTTPKLFMMGQSHLDIAWLWPIEETKRKIARTLSNQLSLLEEYPEYRYTQSQPYLFQLAKELYPELYERIKAFAAEGRVIPEGGAWVEPDTTIPSGESLVRQFLYGKKFFRDEFGVESQMLWLPDVFGYSGNLPQIMKKSGVNYFASAKMFQTYDNVVDPFPYNTFTWEGIDGTEVIAQFMEYGPFPNEVDVPFVADQWNKRIQKEGLSTQLSQFGYGDGGGGANRDDLETLRRLGNLEGVPQTVIESPIAYFEDLQERGMPANSHYVGELYYPAHRGTLTSQVKMKEGNRRGEFALREAEIWNVISFLNDKQASYPDEQFEILWKKMLLNQFHDILPGTSIERVHKEAAAEFVELNQSAEELVAAAAASLTSASATEWTLFNSLGWTRESIVELPVALNLAGSTQDGQVVHQTYQGKQYAKVSVPAFGVAPLLTGIVKEAPSSVSVTSNTLENKFLKVTVNEFGEITSLHDKETGQQWINGASNRFMMFRDQPSRFDAWEIDRRYEEAELPLTEPAQISIGAQGPLFVSLIVKRTINNSELIQEIWLEADSRKVEFRTKVDWKEKNKLLKVGFNVNLHSNEVLNEIQFGYIKRPNHHSRPHDADRYEVSQQKWSAMVEGDRCFSLLNDSKYGISAKHSDLNLSLLRASTWPDEQADIGLHEFNYAVHCWNDGFTKNPIVREGYEFNQSILTVPGLVGSTESYLQCSADNIIIDTVKKAEGDDSHWIVRLYESKGMAANCTLSTAMDTQAVFETDMLEQVLNTIPTAANQVELSFKPFEVKTLKFAL